MLFTSNTFISIQYISVIFLNVVWQVSSEQEMSFIWWGAALISTYVLSGQTFMFSFTHSHPCANTALRWPLSSSGGKWGSCALMEGTSLEELRKGGAEAKLYLQVPRSKNTTRHRTNLIPQLLECSTPQKYFFSR